MHDRQNPGRNRNKVTWFYVGDNFLDTKFYLIKNLNNGGNSSLTHTLVTKGFQNGTYHLNCSMSIVKTYCKYVHIVECKQKIMRKLLKVVRFNANGLHYSYNNHDRMNNIDTNTSIIRYSLPVIRYFSSLIV